MSSNGSTQPVLRTAALSDTGRTRQSNQDYAYAGALPGAEEWSLLAVADGLGGHARGEWASQRTIELLVASLADLLTTSEPESALKEAAAVANATINREALEQGAIGAATTLVAALVRDGQAWWLNVGDSRLYCLWAGRLSQVSADHSWVAEQVRAGLLPPDAMRGHPKRNVVTRTIGFEPTVTADTGGPISLGEDDALLLCSDGLHGPVTDEEMAKVIASPDLERAARRLIDMANQAGGPDNITVVLGRLGAAATAQEETTLIRKLPSAGTPDSPRRRWRNATAPGVRAAPFPPGVPHST